MGTATQANGRARTTRRTTGWLVALALALPPGAARAQVPRDPDLGGARGHEARDPDLGAVRGQGPRDPDLGAAPGPVAVADDEPAELTPPLLVEVAQARRFAAAGRHAEAAAVYEALFAAHADPRLLYHAGRARALAGQHVAAYGHFLRYLQLAKEAGEAARRRVAEAAKAAQAHTVPLRLVVVEGPAGARQPVPEAALQAARVELASARPEPGPKTMVSRTGARADDLRVDAGAWTLRLTVPGYAPAVQDIVVDASGLASEVVLVRRRMAVELRFRPQRGLRDARVRLTATDRAYEPPVERELRDATATVTLSPGPWRIEATARRHQAALVAEVQEGQRTIDLAWSPRATGDASRFLRDRKLLYAGLGILCVTYFGGVGLMLGGANRENRAETRTKTLLGEAGVDLETDETPDAAALAALEAGYPTASYHRDLRVGEDIAIAGTIVAMTGLGTVAAMVPAGVGARKRVAHAELAAGAALVAGGAPWFAWYMRQRAESLAPTDPDGRLGPDGLQRSGHRVGSTMLLGAGLGLLVVPAILLALDASRQRRGVRPTSAAPWLGPGLAGVAVGGRF